jgi:hypothetical protein
MIRVTAEPARKLVRAHMSGMLAVADVHRFAKDKEAAVRGMGLGSGEFLMLVVTEGNTIQTQEVMEAFRDLLLHSTVKPKRIATVRDGVLTRMQTTRISKARDDTEVFDDLASAEAWLFG